MAAVYVEWRAHLMRHVLQELLAVLGELGRQIALMLRQLAVPHLQSMETGGGAASLLTSDARS